MIVTVRVWSYFLYIYLCNIIDFIKGAHYLWYVIDPSDILSWLNCLDCNLTLFRFLSYSLSFLSPVHTLHVHTTRVHGLWTRIVCSGLYSHLCCPSFVFYCREIALIMSSVLSHLPHHWCGRRDVSLRNHSLTPLSNIFWDILTVIQIVTLLVVPSRVWNSLSVSDRPCCRLSRVESWTRSRTDSLNFD